MSTAPSPGVLPAERLLAEASATLTAAARSVTGPDFAELVTLAVAAAAANLGSIGAVLTRRPGSWEAAYVEQVLVATVGHDEAHLFEHRTEPVSVCVSIEEIFADLGYTALFDQARDALERRILDAIDQGGPTEPVEELIHELDALYESDKHDYGAAFAETARSVAAELYPELAVPVEVEIILDWQPVELAGGELESALVEQGRLRTPLPGSGIAPRDYPLEADIVQVETAAGRDPLTRLRTEQASGTD